MKMNIVCLHLSGNELQSHTHTHNQLNITNRSEMTCQSDHVNEGCAPKRRRKILRISLKATRDFSLNVRHKTPESNSYEHHTITQNATHCMFYSSVFLITSHQLFLLPWVN